jgi:hypothetical protein
VYYQLQQLLITSIAAAAAAAAAAAVVYSHSKRVVFSYSLKYGAILDIYKAAEWSNF